jgi:hypothetical protein
MAERERILIAVRTYPTLSRRYIETVCSGGVTDKGDWRRLYPVPLRYAWHGQQYRTFDVVEVDVKPAADGRIESRRPEMSSLRIIDHLKGWEARRQWIDPTILPSLAAMKANNRTLAPVAAREVLDFTATPTTSDWTPKQQETLRQNLLFEERRPLEKIPLEFRLQWRDHDATEYNSLVIAWEMMQTWRTFRKGYDNPVEVMRKK